MHNQRLVLVVLTACLLLAPAASARQRVAVLELNNPAGLTAQEAGYLTDLLRDAARESLDRDAYLIMTRQNVLDLLGDRALADCIGECAVETGRNLGAAYVVAGEVIRFGESLRVSVTLHETATGNLVESEQAAGSIAEDLEAPVRELGYRLFLPLDSRIGREPDIVLGGAVLLPGEDAATASEGRILMDTLRQRTGGAAYDGIKRFREVGELRARVEGRELAIHIESTVIPPEHVHRLERTSLGTFTRVLAGTEAWTTSDTGTRAVTGREFQQLQDAVRGDWVVILRDLDSAHCRALASRRIDGVTCRSVRVTVGDVARVFYLNAETGLVRMVELEETHPITNERSICNIFVESYREVGRLLLPAERRITYDNEVFGVYTLTSFTVNPEVDRALFRK